MRATEGEFRDYCSPYKPWAWIYSYDPLISLLPSHPPDHHARDHAETHKQANNAIDHGLVLGAEIHLWSELTDAVNLDGKLWPRTSAAAEVLWSGPELVSHDDDGRSEASEEVYERVQGDFNRGRTSNNETRWSPKDDGVRGRRREEIDFVKAGRRLAEWRARMVARGVRAEVVQMIWCTQAGVESCT